MAVTATEPPPIILHPNLLTTIDMSSLSQSELHSLSLLSNTPTPSNDAVFPPPILNPTSFNESLSTHTQTYSTSPNKKRRRPRHHPLNSSLLKTERSESTSIVNFLKHHLPFKINKKREKDKEKEKDDVAVAVEIVNRNGVVVDLAALEKEERENEGGPYGGELRRRAEGMEREEELLEMLGRMEGKWCSRRKKRRIVEACLLGDSLPVGWKLIIALRRKGGRFSPYCRRYLSPTGEQLSSCKEVAAYLQSYFGINDANFVRDSRGELQQQQTVDNEPCLNSQEENYVLDIPNSTVPSTSVPIDHEKIVSSLGIDNLIEVQVCDLYECHACNVNFDVKDKYLQHLRSFHPKTTRQYSLGSLERLGVTIKDTKVNSQITPKKIDHLGHVGHHVKDSVRHSEGSTQLTDSARSPCMDSSPNSTSILRMDSLIEIAQGSIQEMSPNVLEKELSGLSNGVKLSMLQNSLKDADSNPEKNSSTCPNEERGSGDGKTSCKELNPCDKVSEISYVCPTEIEMRKEGAEVETSSVESGPPEDKVSEMSLTDGHINISAACPIVLEKDKEIDEDKGSSIELSFCGEVKEIAETNENKVGSTVSPDEVEVEKADWEDETLIEDFNSHDNVNPSMIDSEREHAFTCNVVDSQENFDFEAMEVPAGESGVYVVNTSGSGRWKSTIEHEGSADNKGVLDIPRPLCNKTSSHLDGADEKIHFDYVDKLAPDHAHESDREPANVLGENRASGYTVPQMSLNSSSLFDEVLEKAGQNIRGCDGNLESVIGPDYMELDVIESHMYNSMTAEASISLSDASMDLENHTDPGLGIDASRGSQSEFQLNIAGRGLTTTFCVWCGVEFCHEVVDIEPQADSVGFMCPACRTKISKQFSELEFNFSLDPH